jgi:hypothetical protein
VRTTHIDFLWRLATYETGQMTDAIECQVDTWLP